MNKELKEKIDEVVKSLRKNGACHEETDRLTKEMFAIPSTPEEKREAGQYLKEAMLKRKREDVEPLTILGELRYAISWRYLANRYFEKDSSWLYQRLNHSKVNGKPATFTESELITLADALKDLSHKLLETSESIQQSI